MLESVGKRKLLTMSLLAVALMVQRKHESDSMIFGMNSYSIGVVRGGEKNFAGC